MNMLSTFAVAAALSATLDRKAFNDAAKVAKRVTEKRNTIPILSHVLVDISRDMVTLTATDLDLTATIELPAASEGAGRFTVDTYALADTLAKFKGETVALAYLGNGKAELVCSETGARVTLSSLPADDFPHFQPMKAEPVGFYMPTLQLRDAWEAARHAISSEETRYYLNGVFMHARNAKALDRTPEHDALAEELGTLRDLDHADVKARRDCYAVDNSVLDGLEGAIAAINVAMIARAVRSGAISSRINTLEAERCPLDTLTFAATDGHRLARVDVDLPEGAGPIADSIVPTKMVKTALAIIGKKGTGYQDARVTLGGRIALQLGRVRLESKLIDGTFPDYSRVIPSDCANKVRIDADALASAVSTVTAACNERTRAVALSAVSGEPLVLSASSPEQGRSAAMVDAEIFDSFNTGGDVSVAIGFNAKYLVDALGQFSGGTATIGISDAAGPALITGEGNGALTLVLMPMRVDASVLSVADAKALNMTPMERFMANMGGDGLTAKAFGALKREAVAFLVDGGTAKPAARNVVATLAAIATGDDAGHARGKLLQEATNGGPLRSVSAIDARNKAEALARDPMELVRRSHKAAEREAEPVEPVVDDTPAAPVSVDVPDDADLEEAAEGFTCDGCGRAEIDCSRDPCADVIADRDEPVDEDLAQDPAPAVAESESTPAPVEQSVAALARDTDFAPPPALDPPADVIEGVAGLPPVYLVKIEDVYGRVYFVDACDYASDKPMVRRLHKSGAPFTARESEGGGWIRICRENIARRILARGSVDKPAKPVAAAVKPAVADSMADRIAALEAAVASLSAGQPVTAASVPVAASVARPGRTAAHVRAIRAYLQLRASRTRIAELEQAHVNASRGWLEATEARRTAEREAERLSAAFECRDIALAETARLRVRCDALERLTVDSASLDVRPADKPAPAIIMPVATAGPRR